VILVLALSLAAWLLIFLFIDHHVTSGGTASVPSGQLQVPSLSVLIAARNEAACIGKCLASIAAQKGIPPHTQVIVVNDHSEDGTVAAVQAFAADHPGMDVVTLSLSGTQGKKAALAAGMELVTGEYLYLTDADCMVGTSTVQSLFGAMAATGRQAAFGPVLYSGDHPLQRFVALENLNNQFVTEAFLRAGIPVMANAANMMLHRSVFSGYRASLANQMASGDDVFFVQQLKPTQYVSCYFPEAAVITAAPARLPALAQQRIRWAAKSRYYKSPAARGFAALVWLINAVFGAALVIAPFAGHRMWPLFFLLASKAVIEFPYHRHWFRKYQVHHNLLQALVLSLTYPCYVTAVGILSVTGTGFKWKGRYHKT